MKQEGSDFIHAIGVGNQDVGLRVELAHFCGVEEEVWDLFKRCSLEESEALGEYWIFAELFDESSISP